MTGLKSKWAGAASTLSALALAASPAAAGPHAHHAHEAGAAAAGAHSAPSWFTNYGNYMPRIHCLRAADGSPDWVWIAALIGATALVVVGYLRIYFFWLKCYFAERPENRNKKLWQLANVFLLCASTGYVLSIVMFFWPAYRLVAFVTVLLVGATYAFLWNLKPFELTFAAVRLLRERDTAEAELAERNRSMRMVLDNVGQGFLTIDPSGTMDVEHSKVLDAWFGTSDKSERFADYIARSDRAFAARFELAWETLREGILPLIVGLDQMPRRLRTRDRAFEFEYRPIAEGDELRSLLVIVTDRTEAIQQEQAEVLQREAMMVFANWLRDKRGTRDFFAEAERLVRDLSDGGYGERKLDCRALHTLKGNCAFYGMGSIAELCHGLETKVQEEEALSGADRAELRERWQIASAPLGVLFDDARRGVLEVADEDYDALLEAIDGGAPAHELARKVRAWRFEPTQVSLVRFAEHARALAQRLGKEDIEVQVAANGLRLPPEPWLPFWASFTHVVRNAVDHGIEAPEEREAQGKGLPKVELTTSVRERELVVSVRDDGRGVDWERVRAKARERGLAAETPDDLQNALFVDGLSTKDVVTEISGRGVGMASVAEAVGELKGRIEVDSVRGEGTTMRFIFPLVAADFALEGGGQSPAGTPG